MVSWQLGTTLTSKLSSLRLAKFLCSFLFLVGVTAELGRRWGFLATIRLVQVWMLIPPQSGAVETVRREQLLRRTLAPNRFGSRETPRCRRVQNGIFLCAYVITTNSCHVCSFSLAAYGC